MSIDEQISYWRKCTDDAGTKELALLTFGITSGLKMAEERMARELFDLGNGMAVHFNPGGHFHGWLFRQHPDLQWVSVRKLEAIEPSKTSSDITSKTEGT